MIGFLRIIHVAESRRLIQCNRIRKCGFSVRTAESTLQWSDSVVTGLDSHAYGTMLRRCIQKNDPISAKAIHCDVLKKGSCLDLFASNILLDAYVKAGFAADALKLFDEMPERNNFSYVTLSRGDVCQDPVFLYTRLHREGHELNPHAFTAFLKWFVSLDKAEIVWWLHSPIVKLGYVSNAFVGAALINAYAVCGLIDSARTVFEGILCKDNVVWTGIVTCYVENGHFEESLKLLSLMGMAGFMPNNYTFAMALKASIGLSAFDFAKGVHGRILKTCYESDIHVGAGLLELYTQLGDMSDALKVFNEVPKNDVISWSFMIARFGQNGFCNEAVDLFIRMRQAFFVPNEFTFTSILNVCAIEKCSGLGKQIHGLVIKVGSDIDVYVANVLIEVYAKCEEMDNAVKLFATVKMWRTMFSASIDQNNEEFTKRSAEEILKIDPKDEATFVLLSNMYAGAKQWANVASIRRSMKEKGIKKEPGLSWIEHQGDVHYFSVGMLSNHPDMKLINGMLEWLNMKGTRAGYVPDRNAVLLDMDDEEKDKRLWVHSERSALAYGLKCHHQETAYL